LLQSQTAFTLQLRLSLLLLRLRRKSHFVLKSLRPLMRLTTIHTLHQAVHDARSAGKTIGLVPTMGALHDGHASLIRAAAAETDIVVVTIFVNPLQFSPKEDFAAYPRLLEVDEAIAQAAGATYVFCPSVEEMYPDGHATVLTKVSVRGITDVLDGVARPGHFDGVATVVAKLFGMTGECRAYFGEKDFQQLAVIRRMAADLSFPIEVVGVRTVREANGLAMSSRNRYLSPGEHNGASVIYDALQAGRALIEAGEPSVDVVCARMLAILQASGVVESIDYAACVDAATFATPLTLAGAPPVRLLVACRVGKARLIDNL
jgi:pantoate--beta-alanine ligase